MTGILGQIPVTNASLEQKRRALLEHLGVLLSADAWHWSKSRLDSRGRVQIVRILEKSAFSDSEIEQHANRALQAGAPLAFRDPRPRPLAGRGELPRAWIRQPAASSNRFCAAPYLLSAHEVAGHGTSLVALFRRGGRVPFSERESKIAQGVLASVPWLHAGILIVDACRAGIATSGALSPRLSDVLELLLRGLPRKEIAFRLGISLHTVHGYARDLYRRFGVHSQAELICSLAPAA